MVISDGDLIRRALNDASSFGMMESFTAAAEPLFGSQNVLIAMDDMHRLHRKVVSSAFIPAQMRTATKKIKEMVTILTGKFDDMIKNSKEIDVQEEFVRLTVDIIGAVAFDMNFGTILNGSEFLDDLNTVLEGGGRRTVVPKMFWKYVFNDNDKYFDTCEKLRKIPRTIIEKRMQQGVSQVHVIVTLRLIRCRMTCAIYCKGCLMLDVTAKKTFLNWK